MICLCLLPFLLSRFSLLLPFSSSSSSFATTGGGGGGCSSILICCRDAHKKSERAGAEERRRRRRNRRNRRRRRSDWISPAACVPYFLLANACTQQEETGCPSFVNSSSSFIYGYRYEKNKSPPLYLCMESIDPLHLHLLHHKGFSNICAN